LITPAGEEPTPSTPPQGLPFLAVGAALQVFEDVALVAVVDWERPWHLQEFLEFQANLASKVSQNSRYSPGRLRVPGVPGNLGDKVSQNSRNSRAPG